MILLKNGFESDYIRSLIVKETKNDFMNIDKAINHFKKEIKINLKELIDDDCRKKLIDMVAIRNVFIHNNGIIDQRFSDSETYKRVNKKIDGKLIFITDSDIAEYLKEVLNVISIIEGQVNSIFCEKMPEIIANHYFNE